MADAPRATVPANIRSLSPSALSVSFASRFPPTPGQSADAWFGPMSPMRPVAPLSVAGRRLDYDTGFNLRQHARPDSEISFAQLRSFADAYDIARTIIETRKDQMTRLKWAIVPTNRSDAATMATPESSHLEPLQRQITAFFRRPDKRHFWIDWLRMLLEDVLVIDAPALWKRRTRGGALHSLEIIDGATIKPIIDAGGRTPESGPAFQQVLKGMPAVDYTERDLIYAPRNRRPHRVTGFSPVEQVLMTINIGLKRQIWNLQHWTSGNLPQALIGVPEGWTPDQINQFQSYFDALNEDPSNRRRARFVPGASAKSFTPTHGESDFGRAEEWLARVVCYAFNEDPTPFISQVNRATAESAAAEASKNGLAPLQAWVKTLVDSVIIDEFETDELEFAWQIDNTTDVKVLTEVLCQRVEAGIISINEARADLGMTPIDNLAFAVPMVKTGVGYVPVEPPLQADGRGRLMDAAGNDAGTPPPPDSFLDDAGGLIEPPPSGGDGGGGPGGSGSGGPFEEGAPGVAADTADDLPAQDEAGLAVAVGDTDTDPDPLMGPDPVHAAAPDAEAPLVDEGDRASDEAWAEEWLAADEEEDDEEEDDEALGKSEPRQGERGASRMSRASRNSAAPFGVMVRGRYRDVQSGNLVRGTMRRLPGEPIVRNEGELGAMFARVTAEKEAQRDRRARRVYDRIARAQAAAERLHAVAESMAVTKGWNGTEPHRGGGGGRGGSRRGETGAAASGAASGAEQKRQAVEAARARPEEGRKAPPPQQQRTAETGAAAAAGAGGGEDLSGLKLLGRGRSKDVYQDPKNARKVIVRMQRHAATEAFLGFAQQAHAQRLPIAEHLPNPGAARTDGKTISFRTDKLAPSEARVRIGRDNGEFFLTGLSPNDPQHAGLLATVRALDAHLKQVLPNSKHYFDLGPQNFMVNRNGKLVMNDPVEGGDLAPPAGRNFMRMASDEPAKPARAPRAPKKAEAGAATKPAAGRPAAAARPKKPTAAERRAEAVEVMKREFPREASLIRARMSAKEINDMILNLRARDATDQRGRAAVQREADRPRTGQGATQIIKGR